jgi:hypothetical protein
MTGETSYRLGRYKITESSNGGLRWESHSGFSETRTGACYIEGNILIIGPWDDEKPGFLKREFMEHLKPLPAWEKTDYYCPSRAISRCGTAEKRSFSSEMRPKQDVSFRSPARKIVPKRPDASQIANGRVKRESLSVSLVKEKTGETWNLLKIWSGKALRKYFHL